VESLFRGVRLPFHAYKCCRKWMTNALSSFCLAFSISTSHYRSSSIISAVVELLRAAAAFTTSERDHNPLNFLFCKARNQTNVRRVPRCARLIDKRPEWRPLHQSRDASASCGNTTRARPMIFHFKPPMTMPQTAYSRLLRPQSQARTRS
jgi:hypothetical protein